MKERAVDSLTVQKLRIFAAVAREKSFVKAADTLDLSPPTISDQIRSLEDLFGLRLLDRSRGRRAVELTEAGKVLLHACDEISQSLDGIARSFEAIRRVESGTVAFGADQIFGAYFFPTVYHLFRRLRPDIGVTVDVQQSSFVLEGLRQGKLDLAVVVGANEVRGFITEPLLPSYVIPVGLPGHRLAGSSPAPFRELAREQLVLPASAHFFRRFLSQMAAEAGISLNVVLEVTNPEAQVHAVLEGLGITIMSTHCVANEVAAGDLCPLRVQGFPIRFEWIIVHPPGQLSPSAQAFKQLLIESKRTLAKISSISETLVLSGYS